MGGRVHVRPGRQARHAFALNIAFGDDSVATSVSNAFTAANSRGFKLFFSFDYPGGKGPWPQAEVLSYLTSYVNNGAYYHTAGGQPLVSTFEGPGNASDWHAIKAQTNALATGRRSRQAPTVATAGFQEHVRAPRRGRGNVRRGDRIRRVALKTTGLRSKLCSSGFFWPS